MAERWTAQWKELYAEVVTTGLCTGCSACVVTCPHDVIGYHHEEGKYLPFHLEEELGPDNCIHGEKGCTTCTRACPRFRAWEPAADMHLFGRVREPDEMYGIWKQLLLTRASDKMVHEMGQDGGFVGAMLIWLLEHPPTYTAGTSATRPSRPASLTDVMRSPMRRPPKWAFPKTAPPTVPGVPAHASRPAAP